MASDPGVLPSLLLLAKFGVGSVVMRGAGCTINDLWDRDIDKQVRFSFLFPIALISVQVARTVHRPLANGDISPLQAVIFLSAQLTVGLGVLLSLNEYR